MPRIKSVRIPKYRRQKRRNGADTAFVAIDGQRIYLGEYDSGQSRERYMPVKHTRESLQSVIDNEEL